MEGPYEVELTFVASAVETEGDVDEIIDEIIENAMAETGTDTIDPEWEEGERLGEGAGLPITVATILATNPDTVLALYQFARAHPGFYGFGGRGPNGREIVTEHKHETDIDVGDNSVTLVNYGDNVEFHIDGELITTRETEEDSNN